MDINASCDFIDNNVGRQVYLKIQRAFTNQIQEIEGVIETAFSNEPSPSCIINSAEVFLGEVVEAKIIA